MAARFGVACAARREATYRTGHHASLRSSSRATPGRSCRANSAGGGGGGGAGRTCQRRGGAWWRGASGGTRAAGRRRRGTLGRTRPGAWGRGKQLACVVLTHSLSGASLSSTRSAYLVGVRPRPRLRPRLGRRRRWRVKVGVRVRWGLRVRVDVPHECGGVVRLQLEERRGVERAPQPRLLYQYLHRRALGQVHRRRPSGRACSGRWAARAAAALAASPPRAGANGVAALTGGGGGGGGEYGCGGGGARPPRALLGRSLQRLQ